jgi:hypothetical protein
LDPNWYFWDTLTIVGRATLSKMLGLDLRIPYQTSELEDATLDALSSETAGKMARELASNRRGCELLRRFRSAASQRLADPATCASIASRRHQLEELLARTRQEAKGLLRAIDLALATPNMDEDIEEEENDRHAEGILYWKQPRRDNLPDPELVLPFEPDQSDATGSPLDVVTQLVVLQEQIRSCSTVASWAERRRYMRWLCSIHERLRLEQRHTLVPTLYNLYVPLKQRASMAKTVENVIAECTTHPKSVLRLTSRQFELLVARLFEAQGYNVEVTSATGDGGADVLCMKNDHGVKFRVAVEVKRYDPTHPIGVELVRSFVGANSQFLANKLVYVSTSGYTRGALSFAHLPSVAHLLELKSLPDIVEWAGHAAPAGKKPASSSRCS